MRKKLMALLVCSAVVFAFGACGSDKSGGHDGERVQVVASVYPLLFAAKEVGGEDATVESVTAAGAEPHDVELTPRQVSALSDADLVVYLGGGFQPAVEDVVSRLDPARRLDALEARSATDARQNDAPGAPDPHVWLDPTIMASISQRLGARLERIDPANADAYERRAMRLAAHMTALDDQYRAGLRDCSRRQFVTSHAAFGYLAARYGLEQVSVSGLDPESEPAPARLAEVARFVRAQGISTLFVEELVSPDVAQALARDARAKIEVLSPLESEPESGDYPDAMRSNLNKLREALGCE